jgi:hypothetical protein
MFPKAIVASLAIAVAACEQPLQPSPSSPSQLSAPAASAITRVPVGESVRVTLGAADYVPFDQYGDQKWERVIQVTSSETVTAESRVVLDPNAVGLGAVYVGTDSAATGRNCTSLAGTRSITCVIPANVGLNIVVTVYPVGSVAAEPPTFTFTTQRVEP